MKHIIMLIVIMSIYPVFSQENNFILYGKTKDIKDGTLLLLQDPLSDKFIDSTKVKSNSFMLTTKLPDYPYKVVLWKDSSTARAIWAENKKMTFDASASSFENALITGSVTDSTAVQLKSKYKELKSYDEIVAAELAFIKKNPNNILSAHNLSIMASVFGQVQSSELFEKFSPENKESAYGKKIMEYLNLNIGKTPQIGDKYVDFSMSNQKGEEKKIAEFRPKVILIEFWASWCQPCRKENPELIKTYNKFKKNGFEIIGVSLDENKEDWLNSIQKDKLTWIHLSDLKGKNNKAALIYAVNAIPDNILINNEGLIIGRNVRGEKLNSTLAEIFE